MAIACLVREILKEGSFINKVDATGSYIAPKNKGGKKQEKRGTAATAQSGIGSHSEELQ